MCTGSRDLLQWVVGKLNAGAQLQTRHVSKPFLNDEQNTFSLPERVKSQIH